MSARCDESSPDSSITKNIPDDDHPKQSTMPSNEGASQSGNDDGGKSRPLCHPEDRLFLTDMLCLVRSQLEVFVLSADKTDLRYRQLAGKIDIGRVGIRCIHCTRGTSGSSGSSGASRLPSAPISRNGAISYPKSIRLINQSVRNWQRFHLMACPSMPDDVKKRYQALKSAGHQKSSKASTKYLEEICRRMGMTDTDTGIKLQTGRFLSDEEQNDTTTILAEPTKLEPAPLGKRKGDRSEAVSVSDEVPQLVNSIAAVARETMLPVHDLCSDLQSGDNLQKATSDVGTNGPHKHGLVLGEKTTDTSPGPGESLPLNDLGLVLGDETIEEFRTSPPNALPREQSSAMVSAAQGSISPGLGHGQSCDSQLAANQHENTSSVTEGAISPSTVLQRNHSPHLSGTSQQSSVLDSTQFRPCGPLSTKEGSLSYSSLPNESLLARVHLAIELVQATAQIRLLAPAEEVEADSFAIVQQQENINLPNLGAELYELFSGQSPFTQSKDDSKGRTCENLSDFSSVETSLKSAFAGAEDLAHQRMKRERRREAKMCVPLSDLGLPAALCCIVSSLMDYRLDGQRNDYESIQEVEEDLRLIAAEPEKFLFCGATGDLRIRQDVLYGRDEEISLLIKTFDQVTSANSTTNNMVLVSGYSGTGKSSLIQSVRKTFIERGACFVSGKFDAMRQPQPLSAIVSALDDYCDLLARNVDRIDAVRDAVAAAIGNEGKALAGMIPNLKKIIGFEDGPPIQISGGEALHRMLFMFRMLFWATCSRAHPVVLFLDDLQWADEVSLQLMKVLVTDTMIEGLLFVGCYRDNEVGGDHPLMVHLDSIRHSGSASIVSIHTTNLDSRSVNCLVSEALRLTPRTARSLSDVVLNKTGGNALFAVQFLASLHDEGLLRVSLTSRRWEWDIDQIRNKDIADNVVELMTTKLLRLAPEVQEALSVAACFGAKCQEALLQALDRAPDRILSTVTALDVAVTEGLMVKTDSVYRFSHDQIQCAAYLLIPESERGAFHLRIGRSLWKWLSAQETEIYLFSLVDQLHRGSSLITDNDERVNLAQLSLLAGQMASAKSGFLAAGAYLKAGVGLIVEEDWVQHRDLCFDLYNSCAETIFVLGDFDGVKGLLEKALSQAHTLREKLRPYFTLVQSMGAQGLAIDALHTALTVLDHLGEPFPSEATEVAVKQELARTQSLLSMKSEEDLVQLRGMDDFEKKEAMKFLSSIMLFALGEKREVIPLLVCRMVRLSLLHGVSKESAHGFACYGWLLSGVLRNYAQGYRYGKLSLAILERFQAKDQLAKCYAPIYGFINNWIEPLQSSLDPLKHAFEVGLATGDIHWAFSAAQVYSTNALCSGQKLGPLFEEVGRFSKQMIECKQHFTFTKFLRPMQQTMLILISGSAEEALVTEETDASLLASVEGMNEDELGLGFICLFYQMWLYYLFGKYDLAWQVAESNRDITRQGMGRFMLVCGHVFYGSLAALALARREGESSYIDIIKQSIAQMNIWAVSTPWNCQNKLALMNAEYAYLNDDRDGAARAYEAAIDLAAKHSFLHEQAIALERAGIFHLECGEHGTASGYFQRAFDCYTLWGAHCKARHVREYYL